MKRLDQFGVFVFHEDEEEGAPLKRADNSEGCATFADPAAARQEMDERCIDYGIRTEVVDLDSNKVVLQTTDGGLTWHEPARARQSTAEPVPA